VIAPDIVVAPPTPSVDVMMAAPVTPSVQGLTLIQVSAQLERFWGDRGCA